MNVHKCFERSYCIYIQKIQKNSKISKKSNFILVRILEELVYLFFLIRSNLLRKILLR